MNRAQLFRFSIRLASSLASTRQIGLNTLSTTQVNRFSLLAQSPHFSPNLNPLPCCKNPNLHRIAFFSSKPGSYVDVVLSSEWSEETEAELEKLVPKLTHESVVYALMKLNGNPKKSLDFFKWACVRKGFDPSIVPYTLMLKCLACKEFVEEFWIVASEMQEKGFVIDNRLYYHILGSLRRDKLDKAVVDWTKLYKTMCDDSDGNEDLKYVVKLISDYDWSEEVESKLEEKLTFPLSESFVFQVLRGLWKIPLNALEFFKWVSSCGGYEHDSAVYNEMLKILASPNSIHEFWEVLGKMKNDGFDVDYSSFMFMLRHLPSGDSVKLFEIMMDGTHKPSLSECNLLLRFISRDSNPDVDLACRVLSKCVDAGNMLSKKEYDSLHNILCKIGKFDDAKRIKQEMKDAGFELDNITYSQEVFGLCREKRFEEASNLLEQMEAEGCIPDIKTWTILIQGYCNADQVDDALVCLIKMKDKNVEPDAETLEVLVYGFLSKNKVFGAYRLLVEMVNKGDIKPWQATYKVMIEKLAEIGKLEEALELLCMMKKHGYPPFPHPIVQYIGKSGVIDDAKNILSLLSFNGHPSTACYVKVIGAFVENGRQSEARDLLYSSPYHVRTNKEIREMFGWGPASRPKKEATNFVR